MIVEESVAAKSCIWDSFFPTPDAFPTSCCLRLNVLPAIGPILHKIPIIGEQPMLPLQQELFCFFYHLGAARQVANCVTMYSCCRKHSYKCVIHFLHSLLWLLHQHYYGGVEGRLCTSTWKLILAASGSTVLWTHMSASGWSVCLPVVFRLLKC